MNALESTLRRERGGVLTQSSAGTACRKCDRGASAVGIRVLRLEMGAVNEGRYVEGRGVDVNGSRNRVDVVSWAFRVGLNQMAGSLGGAASPGYLLKSGR